MTWPPSLKPQSIAILVVLTGLVAGLTGCAATPLPPPTSPLPPPTSPATSVVAVLPAGGVFLRDLRFDNGFSFSHAPAGLSIPVGVTPIGGANLAERVNVVFTPADGPVVYAYLIANLGSMGCRITASSPDSIIWVDGSWDGAFTMTSTQAAITLGKR